MKRLMVGVSTVLFFVLGAVSINAQSARLVMKINVPFDFSIGNKVLPAGEYSVTQIDLEGTTEFRGEKRSLFLFTLPAESRSVKNRDTLIFHQINNEYFLTSIWGANDSVGHKLLISKRELEATAQLGKPLVRILTADARLSVLKSE